MKKSNMTQLSGERAAFLGLFIALSMILSYVETLIPVYFGAPGIKPGLANLIILLILSQNRPGEAAAVNLARILLSGFLFGNLFSICYSLAGALLSMSVMYGMLRVGRFHLMTASVAGGVAHNVGQFLLALALLDARAMLFYLPVLLLAGALTGGFNGILAGILRPYLLRLRR